MRRIASICFLLLANLVLLAHVAIPDNHSEVHSSAEPPHLCSHIGCSHSHDQDSSGDLSECPLNVEYTRFESSDHDPAQCTDCVSLHFIVNIIEFDIYKEAAQPFGHAPLIESSYSSVISKYSGLRAPPVC